MRKGIGAVISPSTSHECYVETGTFSEDLKLGTLLVTEGGYLLRILRAENISDAHRRETIAFRLNLDINPDPSSPLLSSKAYLCEVLGKITDTGFEKRGAPRPGEAVYDDFSQPEKIEDLLFSNNGIEIGTVWPTEKPFRISNYILSLPYGIFGDPGTGKTYAAQKLGEVYVENGVPLIIIEQSTDKEYTFWAEKLRGIIPSLKIKVINPRDFPVPIYLLSANDLFELTPHLTKDQEDILDIAFFILKQRKEPFNLNDLKAEVEKIGKSRKQDKVANNVKAKLDGFYNYDFIDVNDKSGLKSPELGDITIFDVSEHPHSEIYTSIVFTILRNLRERKLIKPFILFIDEAHRLLGSEVRANIKEKVRYFVRLARHLQIVPVFISQSPHSIDPQIFDILRSYFLFSLSGDNLRTISRVSTIHPGLLENMPTLETGVCLLASSREYLSFPIFVRFYEKKTEHLAVNPDIFLLIKGEEVNNG